MRIKTRLDNVININFKKTLWLKGISGMSALSNFELLQDRRYFSTIQRVRLGWEGVFGRDLMSIKTI